MFAVKSMDVKSNLLKLKLEMVYRNLSVDDGQTKFSEITQTLSPNPPKEAEPVPQPSKPKRKAVKTIVAK